MRKAVIVTGGMTDIDFVSEYIKEQKPDYMIAADSGMEFFYRAGLKPNLIIGDFDSVRFAVLSYFKDQSGIEWVQLIPEKDDTDTEAAIYKALEKEIKEIHLLGATGSRLDHVLGNIELLGIGLKHQIQMYLVDKHNRIRMVDKSICISKKEQFGKYVSLLPFTPKVSDLTLKGMKYPLNHYDYPCYNSLGISNEIEGDTAEIIFKEGVLLVMETRD